MLQSTLLLENCYKFCCKHKIFYAHMYMIFKYSKRFRFAPSFNHIYTIFIIFIIFIIEPKIRRKKRSSIPGFNSPPGNLKNVVPSCSSKTWGKPCSCTKSTPLTNYSIYLYQWKMNLHFKVVQLFTYKP